MRTFGSVSLVIAGSALVGLNGCSDSDDNVVGTGGTPGTAAGPGAPVTTGGAIGAGGTATGGTAAGGTAAGGTAAGGTAAGGGTAAACDFAGSFAAADAALIAPIDSVYEYGDEGGSCLTVTADGTGEVCASGSAAAVVDEDYDLYWGAGLGFALSADGAFIDASSATGFSYTMTGAPAGLRIGVIVDGIEQAFFTEVVAEGTNTVLWADLAQGSWVETDPPDVFDPTMIKDIQFQIPAGSALVDFSFCVGAVTLDGFTGSTGTGGTGSGGAGSGGAGSGGAASGGTGSGGDGSGGDAAVSFSAVETILTSNCSPCHVDNAMPSGGLDLSAGVALASLVGVDSSAGTKLVAASDSTASYLIMKLEGMGTGDPMPKDKDPLSAADIQTIKDWIDGGATE